MPDIAYAVFSAADEGAESALFLLNRNGHIVFVNAKGRECLGCSMEELQGRGLHAFVEDGGALSAALADAGRGQPTIQRSFVIRSADGRRIEVEATVSLLERCLFEPGGFDAILLETAAEAILAVSEEGAILWANGKASSMFRYAPGELVQRVVEDLIPAGSRNAHRQHRQGFYRNPHPRPMGSGMELRGLRKDGVEFPVEVSLTHTRSMGRTVALAFISDITERMKTEARLRRSEELHRTLFWESPQPLCLFDAETHRFLMVNQAAAKLLRYNKADLEQMRVEDIRVEESDSGERAGRAAAIGGGIWRIRRKDGAVRHVESFESRIEFGDVSGMLVLLTDVTSRLEMEQEVVIAKDRYQLLAARVMQMQEDERKHLSREIHDSLGQELASVRYQLEATQRVLGEKDNGLAVAVKTCDGLLARLREIASSLRPPVLEHLNVAEAIDWLVDQYSRRTKIQFRRQIPLEFPEAPDEVKLAVFRICQESLTNISRHSRATQAVVSVTLRAEFELRIEDNGVGFLKPEAQKRSLGLLGMRERSEQIGGRLQVDSSPGVGTTVSLRVPREAFRTHDG